MSATDRLYMRTNLEPANALKQVLGIGGIDAKVHLGDVFPSAKLPGSTVMAASTESQIIDMLVEEYNFAPTLTLYFDLDSVGDIAEASMRIFKLALALLHLTDWDLALLQAGVRCIFMRKSGELFLNRSSGFWIPTYLDMVKLPYKLEDIRDL